MNALSDGNAFFKLIRLTEDYTMTVQFGTMYRGIVVSCKEGLSLGILN